MTGVALWRNGVSPHRISYPLSSDVCWSPGMSMDVYIYHTKTPSTGMSSRHCNKLAKGYSFPVYIWIKRKEQLLSNYWGRSKMGHTKCQWLIIIIHWGILVGSVAYEHCKPTLTWITWMWLKSRWSLDKQGRVCCCVVTLEWQPNNGNWKHELNIVQVHISVNWSNCEVFESVLHVRPYMYASILYLDVIIIFHSSHRPLSFGSPAEIPTTAGKTKARRRYTVNTSPTQATPKSSGFSVTTFSTFDMTSINSGHEVGAVLMTSRFLGPGRPKNQKFGGLETWRHGTPKLDGWFQGRSLLEMDDDWGYPYLWKPPYVSLLGWTRVPEVVHPNPNIRWDLPDEQTHQIFRAGSFTPSGR